MENDILTEDVSFEEDYEEEDSSHSDNARFSERRVPTSPSEEFWSQMISPTLERRMNKNVYKDGKCCLIENTNHGALQYVHCLSRRLDSRRINDLEFAWGMKRGTLNLDTRSNVFCLNAKFKALWENDKFLLIPEDHILERYITARDSGQILPDIGEGPYNYRFFAHPSMKFVPIHRQIFFPDKETEGVKPHHFLFSSFPFKNLGYLTSHIHPKFAICHILARPAASSMRLICHYSPTDPTILSIILRCMDIIGNWGPPEKDVGSRHKEFLQSQINTDEVYSETSDRTANRQLRPHWSDERLIEERGYVYVKEEDRVVRLTHKEDASHLLTSKKLRIFDEHMFVHETAKTRWKAIQSWRLAITDSPEERKEDSMDDMLIMTDTSVTTSVNVN